jgi:hypothetical protein
MSMTHLTKCQIIMVNLIKPYPFTMAILMDVCPFWLDCDLTLGQKG